MISLVFVPLDIEENPVVIFLLIKGKLLSDSSGTRLAVIIIKSNKSGFGFNRADFIFEIISILSSDLILIISEDILEGISPRSDDC